MVSVQYLFFDLLPDLGSDGEADVGIFAVSVLTARHGHKQAVFAVDHPHVFHDEAVLDHKVGYGFQLAAVLKNAPDFSFNLHFQNPP
ncbi:hypothetical protein DOT_0595 [Desulfosporosinus sp. OT]|nr:hypothetical protein DOT_0595 [Desulfosporosinus sp. OT]